MGVVRMERRGTAEARAAGQRRLEDAEGFVQLTWGADGAPILCCGGVTRAEVAYMACYLMTLSTSEDLELEDTEYDA